MDVASNQWRKATRSAETGGNCVELSTWTPGAIRDSKNATGPMLHVGPDALKELFAAVKAGEFDR
jgi:hypothetical protein